MSAAATVASRPHRRIPWGTIVLWIVAIGTLIYLFVPLVTIVIFTFNDPTTKFNTTWEGFTWDNWLHPFKEQAFTDALIESIKVALVACTLATILGSLIALALARYRIYGSGAINLLLILPLTTPEIVMGASLFTLFFNVGSDAGILDDRDRPHAVLPQFRGDDGQGSCARYRLDVGGRRDGPRVHAVSNVLANHDARDHAGCGGSLSALAGPQHRRLHHHVVRGRPDGDVPTSRVRFGSHRPSSTSPRAGDDHHVGGNRDHRRLDGGHLPPRIEVVALTGTSAQ